MFDTAKPTEPTKSAARLALNWKLGRIQSPIERSRMTDTLIGMFAGLLLGCASAGAVGWCLLLTRSYREVNNRLVIRFAQLFVAIAIGGGLMLTLTLIERLGIHRHSSQLYAALWAYIIGGMSVMFFALRADIRWQKSVGLDRKTFR